MRSLSITALMILAAFVLGLALGGQVPREAAAQDDSGRIGWEIDGDNLYLTNRTDDSTFLALGSLDGGSTEPPPPSRAAGILKVSVQDLNDITIYDLLPVFHCDGLGCRSCDEMPVLCQMPPRPLPQGETGIVTAMDRIPR